MPEEQPGGAPRPPSQSPAPTPCAPSTRRTVHVRLDDAGAASCAACLACMRRSASAAGQVGRTCSSGAPVSHVGARTRPAGVTPRQADPEVPVLHAGERLVEAADRPRRGSVSRQHARRRPRDDVAPQDRPRDVVVVREARHVEQLVAAEGDRGGAHPAVAAAAAASSCRRSLRGAQRSSSSRKATHGVRHCGQTEVAGGVDASRAPPAARRARAGPRRASGGTGAERAVVDDHDAQAHVLLAEHRAERRREQLRPVLRRDHDRDLVLRHPSVLLLLGGPVSCTPVAGGA